MEFNKIHRPMQQNQFIDRPNYFRRGSKQLVNRQFSLKKLSQIARRDLEANSNEGLFQYLRQRPEHAYHEFNHNLMQKKTQVRPQDQFQPGQLQTKMGLIFSQPKDLQQPRQTLSENQSLEQLSVRIINNNKHPSFRSNQLKQDQQLHPIKYRIVTSVLGITPEQVFQLKPAEIRRAQEEYQKQKGKEYLQYSQSHIKPISRVRTEQIVTDHNPQRSRTYIREIFRDLSETKAKKQLREQQAKHRIQNKLCKLQENEQVLGRMVYQKVKKHLRSQMGHKDFNRRVCSEESIDDALINFLKVRIKKAEVLVHEK